MGSRVSRSTSRTSGRKGQHREGWAVCEQPGQVPLSVISAKVKLAERCRSMLSE